MVPADMLPPSLMRLSVLSWIPRCLADRSSTGLHGDVEEKHSETGSLSMNTRATATKVVGLSRRETRRRNMHFTAVEPCNLGDRQTDSAKPMPFPSRAGCLWIAACLSMRARYA